MKKVTFGTKPTNLPAESPDDWVENRLGKTAEPTKRFTIDVPITLHKRVKSQCALANLVMADVMREMLEQRFPAPELKTGEGNREIVES